MKSTTIYSILIFICALIVVGFFLPTLFSNNKEYATLILGNGFATTTAYIPPSFSYDFGVSGTIEEAGDLSESTSPYWWINSGAAFVIKNGVGGTLEGDLGTESKWKGLYEAANAMDTDLGLHPQNIFRLVFRGMLENVRQQAYFKITNDVISDSSNRNESNGLLLFNRYIDGQSLYYTGVRVDGFVVIKKKIKGEYTTLAYEPVFPGVYDKSAKISLLPKDVWIGLRSEITTLPDGTVSIKLFMDQSETGNWVLVAKALDRDNNAIRQAGHAGIRTDFMDVQFKDYTLETLPSFSTSSTQ